MLSRQRLVLPTALAIIALANLLALPGWSTGQDKAPQPKTQPAKQALPSPTIEQKAVLFGTDEKENTKKLNDLAAQGWEYVGPLANNMVLFKRTLANLVECSKDLEFRIVSVNSGKVLDVADGSAENAAKIVQTAYTGAESQHWRLLHVDGIYRIINRKSGKGLDVPEASTDPGVQLIQWDAHGAANQQWMLEKVGNAFRIKAVCNDLILDVEQGSKDAGARVLQWPVNGGENQLWELVVVKGK